MTKKYMLLQRRLLENPEQFEYRGEGNALLKEHFNGEPVDLLRPLLRHSNVSVRRTAMFVANELGVDAIELIDDVIPLTKDSDAHIQWDALESVMVCSTGEHANKFVFVVRELENCNPPICRLAMRLVARASQSQIESVIRLADVLKPNQAVHKKGLGYLLNWTEVSNIKIVKLLNDQICLIKKYGAIIAMRRVEQSPGLIQHAAKLENELVSQFAREAVQRGDPERGRN